MRRELKWKLNTTFAFFIMLICSCKNIKIQRTLLIYRNRVYKVCFSFISLTVRRPDSGLDHSRLWRARTARTWLKNALKNLIKDPSTYFKEKTEGSSSYSSSSSSSDSSEFYFSPDELLLLGEKSGVGIEVLNSTQNGPYNRISQGFMKSEVDRRTGSWPEVGQSLENPW